jgi:hypothetical protein
MATEHALDLFSRLSHSIRAVTDDRRRHLGGVPKLFRADPDPMKLMIRRLGTSLPHPVADAPPFALQEVGNLFPSALGAFALIRSEDGWVADGRMQPIQEPEVAVALQVRDEPSHSRFSLSRKAELELCRTGVQDPPEHVDISNIPEG